MRHLRILLSLMLACAIGSGIIVFFGSPPNVMSFIDIGTHQVPPAGIEVHQQQVVEQHFLSHYDALTGISIFIPKQALKNQQIVLSMKSDKGQILRSFGPATPRMTPEVAFYAIPPDVEKTPKGFHFQWRFNPIQPSKGQTFVLRIESPNGLTIGYWPEGNHRGFYEALESGSLYKNRALQSGNLAFRTYHTYQSGSGATLNEIKMRLLKDKAFIIVYAILLGILVVIARRRPWTSAY